MTPEQYKHAIDQLGLSQVKAAKWLGVHTRTSQGWALGESRIPQVVALLLRLMIDRGIDPKEVR